MGGIKDTYQQTVYRLTPDGLGPFWWANKNSSDEVYQVGYFDQNSGTVESAANLFAFDTFWDLLVGINANNISISQTEFNINAGEIVDTNGLLSQINGLTVNQLNQIELNFDAVELCKKVGIYQLVRRLYVNDNLTLLELREILLYLGTEGKVTRTKVENDLTILLNNGDITQQQFDDFFVDWDNIVGTNI